MYLQFFPPSILATTLSPESPFYDLIQSSIAEMKAWVLVCPHCNPQQSRGKQTLLPMFEVCISPHLLQHKKPLQKGTKSPKSYFQLLDKNSWETLRGQWRDGERRKKRERGREVQEWEEWGYGKTDGRVLGGNWETEREGENNKSERQREEQKRERGRGKGETVQGDLLQKDKSFTHVPSEHFPRGVKWQHFIPHAYSPVSARRYSLCCIKCLECFLPCTASRWWGWISW